MLGCCRNVIAIVALCCSIVVVCDVSALAVGRPIEQLAQLPLSFAARCADAAEAEFHARGAGYHLKVAATEAYIGLLHSGHGNDSAPESRLAFSVLGMRFLGAHRGAAAHPTGSLPGTINHFRAPGTAGRNCTDVAHYGRVRFANVYDGIDVAYYGNGRELEFDLIVSRDADPAAIRFAIDNADNVSVDAGDLKIDVAGETFVLRRPFAYQERDEGRQIVATEFVLENAREISLRIGAYDSSRTLTIDPVLSYGTFLGGSKTEYGIALAVDANGSAFIAGYTTSADFPLQSAYDAALGTSDVDAFVTKLSASGKGIVYSTFLGGAGVDRAVALAIDAAGNAYVTGTTTGGFPTTPGAYQAGSTGSDSFVAKLGPNGNTLLYSTYVQGVEARGIAVDTAGSAYVTGRVATSFATTSGAYQQTPAGAFVLKLNAGGSAATYATYVGGGGGESANSIALDSAGNAYIAGSTDSSTFPVVNAWQSAKRGAKDGFVAKLNASGNGLVYSTYFGGTLDDVVNAIAVDNKGNAYIAGETYSSDFPVLYAYMPQKPGARLTNSSLGSGFFAKLGPTGAFQYSSFLGGEICAAVCNIASPPPQYPGDAAYGIAVDDQEHAYVSGLVRSYTFPLVNSLKAAKTLDTQDAAFVAKVSRSGGALLYSTLTRMGTGEAFNSFTRFPPGAATGIDVDSTGAVYVTGDADSAGNFTTLNAYQSTNGGGQGAIVSKLAGATGTITLTSSATELVTPGPVTLSAAISGVSLSGNVVFMDGPAVIGTAAIAGSKAVLTTALPVGIHRMSAMYTTSGKEIDAAIVNVVVENALVCN